MYGYIDSNRQFIKPASVCHNSVVIYNPTDEELKELGYLLRIDTEPPVESGYVSYYVEIDGKAVQHWKIAPAPSDTERITALEEDNAMLKEENAMLMECILEMSEIVYA